MVDLGLGVGSLTLATDVVTLSTDPDAQKAGRIGGWVLLSTFAASAIYGTYVAIKCAPSEPGEVRRADQAQRMTPAKVASFPEAVLQFQFGTTTEVAARACVAARGAFEAGTAYSRCRSPAPSLAHPDARLEFPAGALNRISLIYPTTPETLQATLAKIEAQAASYYGPPRSGPNAWPAACVENGAVQCLKDGALPGRAFWGFSAGEIELRPSLENENPLVELRYTRYEPGD